MSGYPRDEVDEAFQRYWKVGCVDEDWAAWTELFTPDVVYVDHFWGPLHGRDEVATWIDAVMKGVPEIYTVLDWYVIDGDTVVFRCENRRDNPGGEGPPYWDFPGLSVVRYAGDGLWASEEDYWDRSGARRTSEEYAAACRQAGDPSPLERMTRRHWPDGPDWARTDAPPAPSWLGRDDLPGITKPRELRALLGRPDIGRPDRETTT
jgi:hypothetical protein